MNNLITIAICDDEESIRKDLADKLKIFAENSGNTFRLLYFEDGAELINSYKIDIDLIFLDIEMKTMDGVTTAEEIRKIDETVGIIFLTSYTKYALRGYNVGAMNYIIKPIHYSRLEREMERFLEKYNAVFQESIAIANDTGKYKVLLKDLMYIETRKGNVVLHLAANREVTVYKSMKEMEQVLPAELFQRCHTSYIVNMEYINGVRKLEIELMDGEILPISQPKRKSFMEELTKYWGKLL